MIKEESMKDAVLQLMIEFGLPWTHCSIEPYGKDLVVSLTKGEGEKEERRDEFRYAWNGAQYVLLGIINPNDGEINEWLINGDLSVQIHKFLMEVAKALTNERHKTGA
jgi:hypothetical protein